MWQNENNWPTSDVCDIVSLKDSDPEVRKQVVCASKTSQQITIIDRLLERHSTWYELKRSVAWILICIKKLYDKVKGIPTRNMSDGLTVCELQQAEIQLLKYIQQQKFAEEIAALQLRSDTSRKSSIKKSSKVYRLDPLMSDVGLLCVGGRLHRSPIDDSRKHQVILPKSHHVTQLIVSHFHELSGHSGKEFTLSLLRGKYWIIGARSVIRQVILKCVKCRKCFARPCGQKNGRLAI